MPPSTATAAPTEYWKATSLSLKKGDKDNKYAAKKGTRANVPHNYVSDLQADLIQLDYLPTGVDDGDYGRRTRRAVLRFQRHANQTLRYKPVTSALSPWSYAIQVATRKQTGVVWGGSATGICNASTAQEVQKWKSKGFRRPHGLHSVVKIKGGVLRDDAAEKWNKAIADVKSKGGIIIPAKSPYYSDTIRYPKNGFTDTGGNSKLSFHYTGRAVDTTQSFAGGKNWRWWIVKETVGSKTMFRIYCKTDKQDGTQGVKIAKKAKKYYEFWRNIGEKWMPEGYYLDLTALLKSHDFERIPARSQWKTKGKRREWWHFNYLKDVRPTFLDEMEMIGYTETQLRSWGWSESKLDSKPG